MGGREWDTHYCVIAPSLAVDLFIYGTCGEVGYARALSGRTRNIIDENCSELIVCDDVTFLLKTEFRKQFRNFRKDTYNWKHCGQGERRARSSFGLAVSYWWIIDSVIRDRQTQWHCVSILNQSALLYLGDFELRFVARVPDECLVDLPPVLSYVGNGCLETG